MLRSKFLGSLVGLAVGDCLGVPAEFKNPGEFAPITGIRGGGAFNLEPGEWTDDTSMALCLAHSLLDCKGLNPKDNAEKYFKWFSEGYMSSIGYCFDIGATTAAAINDYAITGKVGGRDDERSLGNGSLMRLAPVALYYIGSPNLIYSKCVQSSIVTHASKTCKDACGYFGQLIAEAVLGADKTYLLNEYSASHLFNRNVNNLDINKMLRTLPDKKASDLKPTGYVLDSLEVALFAFKNTTTFKDGALLAVNLGGDADTIGAIYGQLAGAYYGVSGIPAEWISGIVKLDLITETANRLFDERYGQWVD